MIEQPGSAATKECDWGRPGSSLRVTHLFSGFPLPLFFLDNYGRVIGLNPPAEQLLGRTSQECAGSLLVDLLPKENAAANKSLGQAIECALGGTSVRTVACLPTPNGNVETRCSLVPITDEQGLTDGALLIVESVPAAAAKISDGQYLESSIRILAKSSTDMIENTDLKEIIEDEAAHLVASLGLDFAVFRIISPDDRPLMLCHGIDYKEARELLESKLADGTPMYLSACRGKELLVDDLVGSADISCPLPDIASLASITIHWSNKAYGCAVFGTRRPGANVRANLPVLQVFCNQVGISLRNAALYRELKLRNTELKGLNDISQALSSKQLDVQDVLSFILQTAKGLVGAENAFMFELNPVRQKLSLVSMDAREGITGGLELDVGEGITGQVAKTGKGMLVERADLDPRSALVPGTPEEEPSSIISVPLKFSDRLLGVMTLEKTPGVPFSQRQYMLIEMFSLQAAMALYNASLFDKVKSYASNLQMYNVLLTHDVANFNVPIHGFLEMLLKDPKLDDRQRRYVRSALVQSDNISELISDVRELSRLRSKVGDMPLQPVDLISVITEAKEDIFSNAVYEDIETRFNCPVERADIMADAFLKDLFYNLMSNACKYGNGRPVDISVSEHNDGAKEWWKVQITDEGVGIPEDRKSNMFKRFDQLDTEQGSDGHGLGLSVVGTLCERYGGSVWAEDRVTGDYSKGSRFVVLLPRLTNPSGGA
jgi:signal transduction histidine kinase